MRSKDQYMLLGLALGIVGVFTVLNSFRSVPSLSQASTNSLPLPSLAVSELPGYTGWARPATTLAGLFRIKQRDTHAVALQNWSLTLTCDVCSGGEDHYHSWFYVRAYGPAILTGVVEQHEGSSVDYVVTFHPVTAGQYTVEVVLAYSHPIDPEGFPLALEQLPPPYFEGYLVQGFPLQLIVWDAASAITAYHQKPYCAVEQLTVSELSATDTPLWRRATWTVTSTNKQMMHHDKSTVPKVTLEGYQRGHNSLGFTAAFQYTDCRLIEHLDLVTDVTTTKTCSKAVTDQVHIILIGDSVMRLQKDWIKRHMPSEKVLVTFMEIFGGALRCARLSGPNVIQFQNPAPGATAAHRTVVIFNTGMHDIHRLCGHQWIDDRTKYLTEDELRFSCTTNYRTAIRELADAVLKIPAAVHIFQTTTAAWPKYGNYGVAWDPRYAQELPLDAAFVERFNLIAVSEIHSINNAAVPVIGSPHFVQIVDAYWITLARPDNRETNKNADIGRKLSHPGLEVISHMVRIWWQTAWQLLLCSGS